MLEHTRAHFGQIFMLYPDPEGRIDAILDACGAGRSRRRQSPMNTVSCIRCTRSRTRRRSANCSSSMADKKLVIADGHHRYETALAFRNDHPELEDAKWVMMTFVNMHSPGLRILATHRVLAGLKGFDLERFSRKRSRSSRFDKVRHDCRT